MSKVEDKEILRISFIRGALLYGSAGVVITILILLLPGLFWRGWWNEPLSSSFALGTNREVIIGAGLGVSYALFIQQQTNPIMIAFFASCGLLIWKCGEIQPWIPPLISIPVGFIVAWFAARDLLKEIEAVKGYASKSNLIGEERNQAVIKLLEAITNSRSNALRTAAAQTAKHFEQDVIEPLLNSLNVPNPKARRRIAYALGIIEDKQTIQYLQASAEREQDAGVKDELLKAIARIRQSPEKLIDVIESPKIQLQQIALTDNSFKAKTLSAIINQPEQATQELAPAPAAKQEVIRAEKADPNLIQSVCSKCGNKGFDYDRHYDEYSCANCGWLLKKNL